MSEEQQTQDGVASARSLYEAVLERQTVSLGKLVGEWAIDLVEAGLLASEPSEDLTRHRFRIVVRERMSGHVVHREGWERYEDLGRAPLEQIERNLDGLTITEFCKEYGIYRRS